MTPRRSAMGEAIGEALACAAIVASLAFLAATAVSIAIPGGWAAWRVGLFTAASTFAVVFILASLRATERR